MKKTALKRYCLILLHLMVIDSSFGFSSPGLARVKREHVITSHRNRIVIIAPEKKYRDAWRCRDKSHVSATAMFDLGETPLLQRFIRTDLLQPLFPEAGLVPISYSLILNAFLFTIFRKKLLSALTTSGYFHAMILGTILWSTLGWKGWSVCVLYLIMGQMVTKVKFADKARRGIAESRGGRRGPENVWGSAATGTMCAILSVQSSSVLGIGSELYQLAYVASLATKLSDTFASEIGKAFGKTTFLITNMKRVEPGTEGAVSAEGTAAALFGGFLLSLYGRSVGLINSGSAMIASTLAAFIATNIESVIGATLQGKNGVNWITNEVVNFANTLIGAAIVIAVGKVLGM